jgi:serine protease Do
LRPVFYLALAFIAVVLTSSIVTSYNREIQTFAQNKIAEITEINQTAGEFLGSINEFWFNGNLYDQEQRISNIIFDKYDSVVMISSQSQIAIQGGSLGSGFFYQVNEDSALILTNYHVVADAVLNPDLIDLNVITAIDMWDYDAEVVGYDAVIDIAIIKINKREDEQWEALEFADPDEIYEGDPVVVIGHGMSLPWSSTFGHVVFSERLAAPYNAMLQIDAVTNQGNSGGPVIGLNGKVYGIIESILSPGRMAAGWDGVAFAVHPRQAIRSIEYILNQEYDYVPYSDLLFPMSQLTYEDLRDVERSERRPVYIDYSNAPFFDRPWSGELAGLEQGDILLEMDGEAVTGIYQVIIKTVFSSPGDLIEFKIRRGDQVLIITVECIEIPPETLIQMVERYRG